MDILTIQITRIHEVNKLRHVVVATIDTDCWGHIETKAHVVFDKHIWNRVRSQMHYLESEGHSLDSLEYFENMSDQEYYQRFERTLKDFSDEELIEELQKRMHRLTGKRICPVVTFEVK